MDYDRASWVGTTCGNRPAVLGGTIEAHTPFRLMDLDTSGTLIGFALDVGDLSEPAIAGDGTLYAQTYAQQYGLHAFRPPTTQLWQGGRYRIPNKPRRGAPPGRGGTPGALRTAALSPLSRA